MISVCVCVYVCVSPVACTVRVQQGQIARVGVFSVNIHAGGSITARQQGSIMGGNEATETRIDGSTGKGVPPVVQCAGLDGLREGLPEQKKKWQVLFSPPSRSCLLSNWRRRFEMMMGGKGGGGHGTERGPLSAACASSGGAVGEGGERCCGEVRRAVHEDTYPNNLLLVVAPLEDTYPKVLQPPAKGA